MRSAAQMLRTTPPTVRSLLEQERLQGRRIARGQRFVWRIQQASVEEFLEAHGPFPLRRRVVRENRRLDLLEADIARLRALIHDSPGVAEAAAERDDLRAAVVSLQEALARAHDALEVQQQVEAERAKQMSHLLAAAEAGERIDEMRRHAATMLQEALAGFTRPGHIGHLP